ncbi:hypothetical protein N657DRAFT_676975 [Parathielavia appendiculata]|uniref:Granulins domain-containing protein n=1 Tax=Parathielavia appendiculata TaxID=2587402 RepID=A0AAN6Z860_9PEZI|nr:hypothetical protein N657DRAFT_676975 [Parathielavia appendiculata]
MHRWIIISFLAFGGVLSAALPGRDEQQDQPVKTKQYMSCEQTYGKGWETCGAPNSRSCYSPALGHSCCDVDNNYCGKGTWCAPVAGYCCSDSETLEACARNAGFEIPGNMILSDL